MAWRSLPFRTASVSIKLPILNILRTNSRFENIFFSSLDQIREERKVRDFQNSQSQSVIFRERAKESVKKTDQVSSYFKNRNSSSPEKIISTPCLLTYGINKRSFSRFSLLKNRKWLISFAHKCTIGSEEFPSTQSNLNFGQQSLPWALLNR